MIEATEENEIIISDDEKDTPLTKPKGRPKNPPKIKEKKPRTEAQKAVFAKAQATIKENRAKKLEEKKIESAKLLLEKGEKILEEGYETVNLKNCKFYMDKFSKALIALTLGLVRSRQPGLLNATLLGYQVKFVEKRLDAHNITDPLKTEIMKALFPQKSGEDA